jgi:HTH-type transcriptional regulator, cell division transcriptional repressor
MADGFGARIERARQRKGLSVGAVAAAVGVSAATVYAWENGDKRPRDRNLFRLADVLGVEANWLDSGKTWAEIYPESKAGTA